MRQQGIYDKPDLRLMVEAMLYRMRVGCPWRDLPAEFGLWNSIYQKFNRWSYKDKLVKIFKGLVHNPDLEWEFIDGSIVKAHQQCRDSRAYSRKRVDSCHSEEKELKNRE
jgi:transposase